MQAPNFGVLFAFLLFFVLLFLGYDYLQPQDESYLIKFRAFEDSNRSLTPAQHVHISSAYYVTDTDSRGVSTNAVRMFAIGEKNITKLAFSCNLDGQLTKPKLTPADTPWECQLRTYIIDCKTNAPPTKVTLIGSNKRKHQLQLIAPDPKPRKLVVCFARMFFFEKWQIALASLEIYKLHGADLIVIPISSVIEKLYRVLKAYEKEGSVRLKPAVHVPLFPDLDYDPNTETEWFQQLIAFSECVYDYRTSADFILNVDVDDLIIPKNFDSLHDELSALTAQFPLAASFEFLWAMTQTVKSKSADKFSIRQFIQNSETLEPNFVKSVSRPSRVIQGWIHYPTDNELVPGFCRQIMTRNDSLTFHFRALVSENSSLPEFRAKNASFLNNSYLLDRPIYSQIDRKFQDFLERNQMAKKAFLELPLKSTYYHAMLDCYKKIGIRKSVEKEHFCRNSLQCTPNTTSEMAECTVLKQQHQITQISPNSYISTPILSSFELRENCLAADALYNLQKF